MIFGPRVLLGDIDITDVPYMLDMEYDIGNGVTVYDDLQSLLRDGSLVSSTRSSNRTLTLPIYVEDSTGSMGRAVAGAALDMECRKPYNTVTVYPGDYGQPGAGPAMILDTMVGQSDVDSDPGARLEQAGLRRYVLRLPALPGVRSVDPVTVNWTGPGVVLRSVSSTSGWTNRGSGTLSVSSGRLTNSVASMELRTTPTNPLRQFIEIRSNANGTVAPNVVIGGVSIPNAEVFKGPASNNADVMLVDVPAQFWGTTPVIDFDINIPSGSPFLIGFWTTNYPNIPVGAEPGGAGLGTTSSDAPSANFGIDSIAVVGTARAVPTLSFTAPSGGAFVLTGPDPVAALRERGMAERVFGDFTVSDADGVAITTGSQIRWFPPGDHQVDIGATDPQPLGLNPDGVWPQATTGTGTIGDDATGHRWSYPADPQAIVSFFPTSGVKTILPQTPALPEGYHGDALTHDEHALHPGRSAFAVLDINGAPIATTITYYPTWLHFPTQ